MLQASWGSDPPITSKRRPGPWCPTTPAKCQGPPAGLCAAGRGEPRAAGRVRALRPRGDPAGRRLAGRGRPAPWPGSAGPGGCLGREARAQRPEYPAATLMARFSLQPPCCGDGGGFRITSMPGSYCPDPPAGSSAGDLPCNWLGRAYKHSRRFRWVSFRPAWTGQPEPRRPHCHCWIPGFRCSG